MVQRAYRTRIFSRLVLHGTLVAGSLLFSVPFLWLLGTASKTPAEMYPPRWLPAVPPGIVESPYIRLPEAEIPRRPDPVTEQDWERVFGPAIEAIQGKIAAIQDELPAFYAEFLEEPALAKAIMARLVRRAPDELFAKVNLIGAAWFANLTDAELVQDTFDAVYQRAAVSEVAVHGWDGKVEFPTHNAPFPWRVTEGGAELITRETGFVRPAQEIRYSFRAHSRFVLEAVLPLDMPAENVRRVTVSIHSDGSWHEIWGGVEAGGQRFEAKSAAYLGAGKWQETAWQTASGMDTRAMMKTWLTLEPAGASTWNEPGHVRITLSCKQAKRPAAIWHKYADNYRQVLRMVPLGRYVYNSALLVVLNVAGQTIASSLVAFAFARLRWPARDFCFVIVLATLMVPPQVTMIPVFLIFKQLGWYNTLLPLWAPAFFGGAFYIFLLRQFMRGIPRDLEDSARIDGCGYFGIYARIILPLIKPALAAIGIFTFMATWNEFMGPLIYLSDQSKYPLSLGLFALQAFQRTNQGLMMAASVLMTVPVIALFFLAQRHFIQGVTLTGLKG